MLIMEMQNKVYLRKIDNINIDPIFSDFYSFLNRRVIEKIFYDNYMLCSWILRSNLNSVYDVFYCKGTDNLDFSCKKISQIFFNYNHKFIYPNYKEYKEYYELNINRINLNNQILKKILGFYDAKVLSEFEFNKNIDFIHDLMKLNFSYIDDNNLVKNKLNKNVFINKLDNLNTGEFSFMGCYFDCHEEKNLKNLTIYKMLEKYYGMGENESIYYKYRMNGDIYAASTRYLLENNFIYTGVFSSYNDELFNDVIKQIYELEFDEIQLDIVKKRFLDDLYFSFFQYGEQFTMFPYIFNLKENISFFNLINQVNDIKISDFLHIKNKKKYLLKVAI